MAGNVVPIFQPPNIGEVVTSHFGNAYSFGPILNCGGFACVYECTNHWGRPLVAKVISPNNTTYEACEARCKGEVDRLDQLRHPNITYVHDAFEWRSTFYIILERASYTLETLFSETWFVSRIWLPGMARELLEATAFLHSRGYVHKDIHLGNVFVHKVPDALGSENFALSFKLGDLGISCPEAKLDDQIGTLAAWMLPPEALNPREFGKATRSVDIYHLGLLFLQLCVGQKLSFSQEQVLNGEPRKLAESLSDPVAPVIAKMLRRHVAHRPSDAFRVWQDLNSVLQPTQIAA